MLGGGREGQAFSPPRYHLQHPRSFASSETGPRYAQGVGAHSVFWSDFRPDRSECAVIASEAKQSRGTWSGLLRCSAPRNDDWRRPAAQLLTYRRQSCASLKPSTSRILRFDKGASNSPISRVT